jgi:DNA invertase Pin-like site-specific DNA recombinase
VRRRGGPPTKAAIYARVSTLDQQPENQLQELRRYVQARGWYTFIASRRYECAARLGNMIDRDKSRGGTIRV